MKENLLDKWLVEKGIKASELSRAIKCNPASIHAWRTGKSKPAYSNAWKIHKITKGEIPITYWGIGIINGRFKKIDDEPMEI